MTDDYTPRFNIPSNHFMPRMRKGDEDHPFSRGRVLGHHGPVEDWDSLSVEYGRAIALALEGRNSSVRKLSEQALTERPYGAINAATVSLIAGLGIDPVPLIALSAADDDLISVYGIDGGPPIASIVHYLTRTPPRVQVTLSLGQGVSWESDSTLVVERHLPETLMESAQGRRLSEVVSHPLLDAFPLTIDICAQEGLRTVIHCPSGQLPEIELDVLLATKPVMPR